MSALPSPPWPASQPTARVTSWSRSTTRAAELAASITRLDAFLAETSVRLPVRDRRTTPLRRHLGVARHLAAHHAQVPPATSTPRAGDGRCAGVAGLRGGRGGYLGSRSGRPTEALLPLVAPLVSGTRTVAIGSGSAAVPGWCVAPNGSSSRGATTAVKLSLGVSFSDAVWLLSRPEDVADGCCVVVDDNWFFDTEVLVWPSGPGCESTRFR